MRAGATRRRLGIKIFGELCPSRLVGRPILTFIINDRQSLPLPLTLITFTSRRPHDIHQASLEQRIHKDHSTCAKTYRLDDERSETTTFIIQPQQCGEDV
jgi:hypothetical protein